MSLDNLQLDHEMQSLARLAKNGGNGHGEVFGVPRPKAPEPPKQAVIITETKPLEEVLSEDAQRILSHGKSQTSMLYDHVIAMLDGLKGQIVNLEAELTLKRQARDQADQALVTLVHNAVQMFKQGGDLVADISGATRVSG